MDIDNQKPIFIEHYFKTPFFFTESENFIEPLIKATDPYIEASKKRHRDGFGMTFHSTKLYNDESFEDFMKYITMLSIDFMNVQGYEVNNYTPTLNELWVQEFTKKGGGHHETHVHYNQHVSGFYFLKCSDQTSFPVFHDPRPGALMSRLDQKKRDEVSDSSPFIHCKIKPGTVIVFPGWLPHEFTLDNGKEPFRFIHWNFQFLPKEHKNCDNFT